MQQQENTVLEVAIFTIKPEAEGRFAALRQELTESLKSVPGFIHYRGLEPVGQDRHYVDLVTWRSLADAESAAQLLAGGDPRFQPFVSVIDQLVFMGHQQLQHQSG